MWIMVSEENLTKIRKELEGIFENGTEEEYYLYTTFKENQIYWFGHLAESIVNRRIAVILLLKGYSTVDIKRFLNITNEEIELIKAHIEKYKNLHIDLIIQSLIDICQEKVIQRITKTMISHNYSTTEIISVIKEIVPLMQNGMSLNADVTPINNSVNSNHLINRSDITRKMIEKDISIDVIAEITGISQDEVVQLKREYN